MMQQQETATPTAPWHEPVSRPIDVHRWSDYPQLNRCLADLVAEIESTEGRTRRRKEASEKRFRDAVRCIVLDLYVAWVADRASTVGVPLGKDKFRPGNRYRAIFLTYDTFLAAFDGLVSLGYVLVVQKGYNYGTGGPAQVTRVRATEKLIDLLTGPAQLKLPRVTYRSGRYAPEPIILRDKEGDPIVYPDTAVTTAMREEVERINSLLGEHWIDLRISDAQMAALNARMSADYVDGSRASSSLDLTAKRLRRIFNNSDWEQGGRFYGGWWQNVPRKLRRFITIDDKQTVEVDYSGMHAVMLYAIVGAELGRKDAHDIGLPSVPRKMIKDEFNKLLNAEGRIKPDPKHREYGITSKQLKDRIIEKHGPIAHFFRSGHGTRLQRKDADLAAQVMLRFLDMDYVCLPVHDSFLVHKGLEADLVQTMQTEFANMFGVEPRTDPTHGVDPSPAVGLVDTPIGEILFPRGDYSGYETRLIDWRVARGQPEVR